MTYFERKKTTSEAGVVAGLKNIVKLVGVAGGSRRERYSPHANALNSKK